MKTTLEMAREVYGTNEWTGAQLDRLEQLVALARADEREACERAYEAEADTWTAWPQAGAAKRKGATAIRAREAS